ncbi:HrgA protein [Citrobacter freundii]|uniref:HrgA protein n=1 Tax=Citrobacter TaxID=544 RepID=UPI001900C521|nr:MULTISPECIES: HrgA protein [Citrobacter]MBJ9816341.1 HrgA protein [Citrobacter koseri]MDH0782247.1 HrgA protein [Citrobacter freundii]
MNKTKGSVDFFIKNNNNSLSNKVFSLLRASPNVPFTARQLAIKVCKSFPEYAEKKLISSENLSSNEDLISQVAAEIGAQGTSLVKKNAHVNVTAGKPRKYLWVEDEVEGLQQSNDVFVTDNADVSEPHGEFYSEHDLYPLLSWYASSSLNVHVRRIDEKKSKKGPFKSNKWVHPDVVGIQDIGHNWCSLTKDAVSNLGGKRAFLWSFEVKKSLAISNVREAYFQAVSNSSWAHFGYLVAANIENNCIDELAVLNAAHGIGVILLDVQNPSESQILLQAKEKLSLDWQTINRLIELNPDFKEYIELLNQFLLNKKLKIIEWGIEDE